MQFALDRAAGCRRSLSWAFAVALALVAVVRPATARAQVVVSIRTLHVNVDSVSPEVVVISPTGIDSVVATADGQSRIMNYAGGTSDPTYTKWKGSVSLLESRPGTKTIVVTATDVFGATGSATHTFEYDFD